MKKFFHLVERGFAVLSLVIYSGGPLNVILSGGASEGDGAELPSSYPLIQVVFLISYIITFLLLIRQWKQVFKILNKEKTILLIVGLATISFIWSYIPAVTLKRSVALIGTTLFGTYFALRYSIRNQLQLLGWTFGLIIMLSFLFVGILPEYGVMGGPFHEGLWRGIYTHKNILGRIMTLSAFTFFVFAASTRKISFIFWCGFGFSLSLLLLSTSKTALAGAAIIFVALGLYWTWQRCYVKVIPALIAVIITGGSLGLQVTANIYVPLVLSQILPSELSTADSQPTTEPSSAERNSRLTLRVPAVSESTTVSSNKISNSRQRRTMTGRIKLWSRVLEAIEKRPWLGYGFGDTFWMSLDDFADIWGGRWKAPNAHNGLLDIGLNLGLLGVLLFLIGFIINFSRAINLIRTREAPENLWPLLYLTFLVLINMTTSSLIAHNNIFWLLYVSVAITMVVSSRGNEGKRD